MTQERRESVAGSTAALRPDRAACRRDGPQQSPIVGWLWIGAAGVSIVVLALGLRAWLPTTGAPEGTFFPLGILLIAVPVLLYRHGLPHFAPSAQTLMAHDLRDPVLYLRAFDAESSVTLEEQGLERLMLSVGPLVAIGDPRDGIPPLGASRAYLTARDADWQGLVLKWLARAQLVFMAAGKTPGLAWEMEQCRRKLEPAKLIVLVPADLDIAAFQTLAARVGLEAPIPAPTGRAPGGLAGFVAYDADWRGAFHPRQVLTMLDDPRLPHEQIADEVARLLAPALRARGHAVREAGRRLPFMQEIKRHWRGYLVGALAAAILIFVLPR